MQFNIQEFYKNASRSDDSDVVYGADKLSKDTYLDVSKSISPFFREKADHVESEPEPAPVSPTPTQALNIFAEEELESEPASEKKPQVDIFSDIDKQQKIKDKIRLLKKKLKNDH